MTTKRLEETAYHEAGHAVACWHLRVPFKYVTIVPDDDTLGRVKMYKPPNIDPQLDGLWRARQWIEKQVMVNFAGEVAVKKVLRRKRAGGTGGDVYHTIDISAYSVGSPEASEAFLKWMYIRTTDMFELFDIQVAIHALARELLQRKTINRRDAVDIIRDAIDEAVRNPAREDS